MALKKEIEAKDRLIKLMCVDWADDDTRIKDMAITVGIVDDDIPDTFKCGVMIVEELVAEINRLRADLKP